jgi:hypothetical protein
MRRESKKLPWANACTQSLTHSHTHARTHSLTHACTHYVVCLSKRPSGSLGAMLELEHQKEILFTPLITSPPTPMPLPLHSLPGHHLQITINQFIQLGSKPMTSVVGLLPRRLFAFSTLIMLMGCGVISIVAPAIAVWVSGHCRRGPCCTFQCA